jgi:hypothetical protein
MLLEWSKFGEKILVGGDFQYERFAASRRKKTIIELGKVPRTLAFFVVR